MNVFYGLIVLLVLGFFGSYLTGQTKRFSLGFQSVLTLGGGFLFLGLLLGPYVSGSISESALKDLSPVISLGLGWMGLLVGLQFDWKLIRQISREVKYQTAIISIITILLVFSFFYWIGNSQLVAFEVPFGTCLCLACVASLSDYSAMALIKNVDSARGGIVKQIQLLTDMRVPYALLIMALWYGLEAVFQHHSILVRHEHTGLITVWFGYSSLYYILEVVFWFVIAIGLGFSLGCLLHYLTSERLQSNEMLLIITGTVVLSSGLASYIHTSPLFVNFILGLTLTNLPNFARGRLSNRLMQTERPFFTVFMIFVGALWVPQNLYTLLFIVAFILVRFFAILCSVKIAKRTVPNAVISFQPIFLGMISQGGMPLAIAVDYYLIQTHQLMDQSSVSTAEAMTLERLPMLVLHIVIVSVVVHQILGANTLRYLLRRSGVIKPMHKKSGERRGQSSVGGRS